MRKVMVYYVRYTPCPKKSLQYSISITSSNTDRFSKFFHCHNLLEICNRAIVKSHHMHIKRVTVKYFIINVRKLACQVFPKEMGGHVPPKIREKYFSGNYYEKNRAFFG